MHVHIYIYIGYGAFGLVIPGPLGRPGPPAGTAPTPKAIMNNTN